MTIIKLRRGLSAVLAEQNPLLREGEPCVEVDTGKLKIGNGVLCWLQLGYLSGEGAPGPQGEPGANGTDGADGQSAYQLAVALGFVGTEGQWLLSLKGEPGSAGVTGSPGAKGDTGSQGPQGIQGPKGDTGLQGPKGDTGDQGPQGIQGPKGDTGNTGAAGTSYTGPKITTASSAPASPTAGDVWIDTSS
jgi:hypothetical protein